LQFDDKLAREVDALIHVGIFYPSFFFHSNAHMPSLSRAAAFTHMGSAAGKKCARRTHDDEGYQTAGARGRRETLKGCTVRRSHTLAQTKNERAFFRPFSVNARSRR